MSRYTIIKALALAVLGSSRFARVAPYLRSPDESVRRRAAAHMKRNAKAAARLRWRAAGGASTLAERTAAGVPGV